MIACESAPPVPPSASEHFVWFKCSYYFFFFLGKPLALYVPFLRL